MNKLAQRVLILCCVTILFTGANLPAQNSQGGTNPLSFGIRAGFSAPVITVDNQPASINRIAPVVGGFAQYRVLPWVAASIEVLYTQYGGNNISPLFIYSPDSPILNNLVKTDLNIHSIEIPVLAKIGIPGMSGAVKPYLSVGGSAAFFLQADATNYFLVNNGVNLPILNSANNIVTSRINGYDFSGIAGTGVDFQGDKYNFSIEIYYRIGLSDLNANVNAYAPSYRTNAFGLKIGIGL